MYKYKIDVEINFLMWYIDILGKVDLRAYVEFLFLEQQSKDFQKSALPEK